MKKLRKLYSFFFALVILGIFLVSCDSGKELRMDTADPTEKPTAVTYDFQTWKVTKSTGLYDEPDADAKMIDSLSFGTRVKDISENDHLSECSTTEGIEVCLVIVVETNQQGYVIKKWLQLMYN